MTTDQDNIVTFDGAGASDDAAQPDADPVTQSRGEEGESSLVRVGDDDVSAVPLWLVTFTDVMALMLTFFVLLYSMSTPQEDKWEEIVDSLSYTEEIYDSAAREAGTQDYISLDKIEKKKALDPAYLQALIDNMLKENDISGVMLIENRRRLIISLPAQLLFNSGMADMKVEGKKLIFELGGVLSRVKNRIEVIGHADPMPISGSTGRYSSNWELSLARAASVSKALRDVGYERPMTIRGLSSARFDELPEDLSVNDRYLLARRVDIVLMDDSGYRQNAFDIK
jgi:chemotaxis protein MotB